MAKTQPIRQQPQAVSITAHYRAIGPAAIVAALLHTKKRPSLKPKAA